ncbi:MAG: TlpA family protein disulfide reductase [Asgard group archaeon]|nr:TlpA family protein disulfide reductase [Asgard group archaeon]
MKSRKLIFITITLLIITISPMLGTVKILSLESRDDNKIDMNLLDPGSPPRDFTLIDVITGGSITFSYFSGRVIILDFFNIDCPFCTETIPVLGELRKNYPINKLTIISVDVSPEDDTVEELQIYADENDMNWYVVRDTLPVVTLGDYYEVTNIPTFYVFDQNQNVYAAKAGAPGVNDLDAIVSGLLSENPGGQISEFWLNNWYWFLIASVFVIIITGVLIQRRRIIVHNRKVREEKTQAKSKRKAQKYRNL